MKSLKRFADYFIFNHFFIGCCAGAQTLLTYKVFNIPVNAKLVTIISLSTCLVYNACELPLKTINLHKPGSIADFKLVFNRHKIVLFTILGLLILFMTPMLKMNTVIVLFFMLLICLVYSLPLIDIQYKRKNLREIYILKVFIISIIWVLSTVYLPYIEFGKEIGILSLINLMFRQLFFIAVIALTFDLRDIQEDTKNNLFTIPVIIGQKNSKLLCLMLLSCSLLLALYQQAYTNQELIYPAFISAAATTLLVFFSNNKRNRYYYVFWLDGMCLFQYLITLGFNLKSA